MFYFRANEDDNSSYIVVFPPTQTVPYTVHPIVAVCNRPKVYSSLTEMFPSINFNAKNMEPLSFSVYDLSKLNASQNSRLAKMEHLHRWEQFSRPFFSQRVTKSSFPTHLDPQTMNEAELFLYNIYQQLEGYVDYEDDQNSQELQPRSLLQEETKNIMQDSNKTAIIDVQQDRIDSGSVENQSNQSKQNSKISCLFEPRKNAKLSTDLRVHQLKTYRKKRPSTQPGSDPVSPQQQTIDKASVRRNKIPIVVPLRCIPLRVRKKRANCSNSQPDSFETIQIIVPAQSVSIKVNRQVVSVHQQH